MANTIPEIPEDAPFSSEQRAWLKSYLTQLVQTLGKGSSGISKAAGKPRALFLYGSQSGNAQALSEGFAEVMNNDGWAADAVDMENHATVDLVEEPLILVVTSTWGEGDPPDNAVEFWEKFKSSDFPKLPNSRFSVLSLGDTNYADFCEMGKLMDKRLEELGAERIAARVDCDVDYEDPAEEWFRVVSRKLDEIGKEVFTTTVTTDGVAEVESVEDIPFGKKRPFPAPLKYRYKLNLEPSPRDTRHIELKLNGSGLEYEVGDAVATYPLNDTALVDEIISILPFNTAVSVTAHDGRKLALRDALLECYDIRTVTKAMVKKWAPLTCHPYLHAVLEDDEQMSALIDGIEVVDLIYDFPADIKSGQDFIGLLRKLQPRLYSIASSPKKHPDEVHLTVAKVVYESRGRVRKGVASNFLCEWMEEGQEVRVFMQPTKHFKLPTDLSKDVIMVGPGTGIAPFRAFLEERQVTKATGRNWLFFGNPHESTDFFYKEEFDEMAKEGVLTRIDCAWSRDQKHKIYVQDKIREFSEEVWKWLEGGAHFYVCGDATYMAGDVDKALFELVRKYGGYDHEGATVYLKKLKDDGRYQRDVY
ncbi:MAG: flavodoxin domain-containing protein [Verrucomicrobiales bacterium]|nr:flavodoxin domain-containing protein [Verrucomicrobiales bacterium]